MKLPPIPILLLFLLAGFPFFNAVGQDGHEPATRPLVIAHRGASEAAPENTLASAKLGFENGGDAVEVDIWLSRDGHPVVIHDRTTKRTTNRNAKVKETDLVDLQTLDAGSWKDKKFAGERIPTLDQILEARPEDGVIVIEIKDNDPAIVPAVAEALKRTGTGPGEAAMIAFDFNTLKAVKERLPKFATYWLVGYDSKKTSANPDIDELIEKCRDAGFNGLNLRSGWPVDDAFVKKVHDAGLELYIWTVNDRALIRRLSLAGVDGITTDRPEVAVQVQLELSESK